MLNHKELEDNLTSSIRESLGLSTEKLGQLLQVSSRTIARWEERVNIPRNSSQILRIHKLKEIVDIGLKVYTAEGLQEFLSKPQPIFNGHTAYQLISIGEYDSIISALAADFEGLGF
ncbi:MAG: transcriptional regulator [Candidatus Riflebacteria bacterium]|nr:transcriptional regulator [Candidatus Riflebacteria bacterium]